MQLRTLGDMKKQEKKTKGNTTSYTGGQNSGLAVENPDVAKLMEKASLNSKTQQQVKEESKSTDKSNCKITLYQNGFIVQNQDFRPYSEEKSKIFMNELNQGIIPKQLRAKYPKGGLTVSLSDHTSDVYTLPPPPPPPPYTAFSGSGVSLGSKPTTTQVKQEVKSKPKIDSKFPVNEKKQTTIVQIRYHNGDKQTLQVNLTTKIGEIYQFVSKVSQIKKFDLISGFPPAVLKLQKTIQELQLQQSTIIQKN